jgi:hypothetical protein
VIVAQHIFPRDSNGRVFLPYNAVQPSIVKVSEGDFLLSCYGWYESGKGYQAVFLWPFGSAAPMVEVPLGLGNTDRGWLWAADQSVLLSYYIGARLYTTVVPGFAPYRTGHTHEAVVRLT